jgi:hypothetical protein
MCTYWSYVPTPLRRDMRRNVYERAYALCRHAHGLFSFNTLLCRRNHGREDMRSMMGVNRLLAILE